MRTLVRWHPFHEVSAMGRAMDRLFDESWTPEASTELGYIPLDVSETDEAFEVEAALPGLKPEDVDVQVHGDTVTIKGEVKEEAEEKDKSWLRRERRYGVYARSFTLPTEIDADKASAEFEDGVLKLSLPKSEAVRPKSIKIGTKGVIIEGAKS